MIIVDDEALIGSNGNKASVHTATSHAFQISTRYEVERVLSPKTLANDSQELVTE